MGYRGTKFTRQKIAALRQLDAGFIQVELTSCCGLLTSPAPLLSICRLKVCSVEAGGATVGGTSHAARIGVAALRRSQHQGPLAWELRFCVQCADWACGNAFRRL